MVPVRVSLFFKILQFLNTLHLGPSDGVLLKALHNYAKNGYPLKDRLDWLAKDFGYHIK
jgi:hypothetical protein